VKSVEKTNDVDCLRRSNALSQKNGSSFIKRGGLVADVLNLDELL
jgi:hypothetical protein